MLHHLPYDPPADFIMVHGVFTVPQLIVTHAGTVQQRIVEHGLIPDVRGTKEWGEFVTAETAKWGEIVRRIGLRMD